MVFDMENTLNQIELRLSLPTFNLSLSHLSFFSKVQGGLSLMFPYLT
jgi:hypothetical protein